MFICLFGAITIKIQKQNVSLILISHMVLADWHLFEFEQLLVLKVGTPKLAQLTKAQPRVRECDVMPLGVLLLLYLGSLWAQI